MKFVLVKQMFYRYNSGFNLPEAVRTASTMPIRAVFLSLFPILLL